MRLFFYLTERDTVIRIRANRRPARNTVPPSGTWIVTECAGDSWRMGAAPEITLPVLERQKFIGSIKFK